MSLYSQAKEIVEGFRESKDKIRILIVDPELAKIIRAYEGLVGKRLRKKEPKILVYTQKDRVVLEKVMDDDNANLS